MGKKNPTESLLSKSHAFDQVSEKSEEHLHMHPNQENEEDPGTEKEEYTGVQKYFNRFDELIMKPLFIHNYDKAIMKKVKAFHKTYSENGGEIARSYMSKK